MNETTAIKLRAPFPPETIGKLPRVTCGACRKAPSKACERHEKRDCRECGNWMSTAHIHLDYVGHAAVTDRLLQADPAWFWEPVAFTDDGLPLVRDGQLWIRLTVGDVTRLGVGSADGKTGPDAVKEMIGDAIRNAAMRFGVALDLWSKEDLHARAPEPLAEADVVKALVDRMNALPDGERQRCKAMFVDAFGRPDELRASSVGDASDMIGAFEAPKDDPPPTGAGTSSGPDGPGPGGPPAAGSEHAADGADTPADDAGLGTPDEAAASAPEVAQDAHGDPGPVPPPDLEAPASDGGAAEPAAAAPRRPLTPLQRKMHALAGQAWPDVPSMNAEGNRAWRDKQRKGLLMFLTGRDTSHDLADDALLEVCDAIQQVIDGHTEVVQRANGEWTIQARTHGRAKKAVSKKRTAA